MIAKYESHVIAWLGSVPVEHAKIHARAVYPRESCGFIAGGIYVPCDNAHETPLTHFRIEDPLYDEAVRDGTLTAIVHSHPGGPIFPSETDMIQQLATGVPWVVIALNDEVIGHMVAWGGDLPIAPVIARPFIHGIFDCYSLVRDTFRLGRERLAEQGVHWPLQPIELPEVPRDDNWWQKDSDLYTANFERNGFRVITRAEARPGDGFLIALGDRRGNPKQRLNHAGLLLEHDQILHHAPTRPSCRVPAGPWAHAADLWVRYEGPSA